MQSQWFVVTRFIGFRRSIEHLNCQKAIMPCRDLGGRDIGIQELRTSAQRRAAKPGLVLLAENG